MKKRPLDKSGLFCYNNVVYYYVRIMIRRKTMFKLNSEQKEFLTKLEEKFRKQFNQFTQCVEVIY